MGVSNVSNVTSQTFEKAANSTNGAVALTANTSAVVLAANANRVWATIVNNGATDATISFSATATLANGVPIKANGGAFNITQVEYWAGVVSAISTGAISLGFIEGSK